MTADFDLLSRILFTERMNVFTLELRFSYFINLCHLRSGSLSWLDQMRTLTGKKKACFSNKPFAICSYLKVIVLQTKLISI